MLLVFEVSDILAISRSDCISLPLGGAHMLNESVLTVCDPSLMLARHMKEMPPVDINQVEFHKVAHL